MSKQLSNSRCFLFAFLIVVFILSISMMTNCDDQYQAPSQPEESQIPTALSKANQQVQTVMEIQDRHTEDLLDIPGVVGTGTGLEPNGEVVVKVFTIKPGVSNIPDKIDHIPVVTEVTGMFVAQSDPTSRFPRPVPIGVSTGHPDITAGTIGCRVVDVSGNVYALSNNHVYANCNDASIGDSELQPGPYDGGQDPEDKIGSLYDYEPIQFDGSENTIDAAIASTTTSLVGTSTPSDGYGIPSSTTKSATVGLKVQKFGRTTSWTKGEVAEVNVTVDVCYETRGPFKCVKLARFVDQISISPGDFSDGGDSGSLIITDDSNKNAVGLLFAGSDTRTLANPIDAVLNRFSVMIDEGAEVTDIGVTDVNAPSSVVQGELADVSVTVKNLGNQDVSSDITVTLTDDTDEVTIGTQTISGGLTAGASTTLTYSWDTGNSSLGDHTLTASHDFTDDNTGNDAKSTVVTVESPIIDIAISAVDAPSSVVQGDVVSVDVTVDNVGNQDVSNDIIVTLTDDTDGVTIGTQTISGGLVAGTYTTLTYSWNTEGATISDHTLTASHDFTDDDASNDSKSTTVSVNELTELTVTGIDPNSMQAGTTVDVTIYGSGFEAGADVTFENGSGPTPSVSNIAVVDGSTITATVTAKSGGPPKNRIWDVRVTNPDGSSAVLVDGFTVTP